MCHSKNVTPFKIKLNPGQSIFEQIVFAATKAFVSGELPPGTPFPSVRVLAADLRIHPNTAHKVIQHLIQERWLEVRPGIGTAVAQQPKARPGDRQRLLKEEVDQLVVEARRVGATLDDVLEAIEANWKSTAALKAVGDDR
jgi:DNA-binding transcriptional regulator YhcF (GntR family)